jgi:hypothetical protein
MDEDGAEPVIPARLAAGFERWTVTVAAGADRPTSSDEWAGALVVIERGAIEVVCRGGAHRAFGCGSYLSLSWLPVVCLRNPGPGDAVVVAYRRVERPKAPGTLPYPA